MGFRCCAGGKMTAWAGIEGTEGGDKAPGGAGGAVQAAVGGPCSWIPAAPAPAPASGPPTPNWYGLML